MRVGRRPTATATTAGATAGPGETLNSLQGRTGNEHRFVCSRNERSLCPPRHTLCHPLCYPLHHRRVAPPRVYLAARFHRYRANRGKPRAQRERERMRKSWLRGVAGWLARRGCSLVTRPGNVTRSFIRSAPLACTPGSRGR